MMANTGSPVRQRRCGAVRRVDLVIVFIAAMLCSASYCLGIWHNNRGAADSRVLGPSAALAAAMSCGDDDEPLDFEAHHNAEGAQLSVSMSVSSSTAPSTGTRRALRGAVPRGSTVLSTVRDRWAGLLDGAGLWFMNNGAARA